MSDVTVYSVFTGIKHRIECLMSVYSVFTGIKQNWMSDATV